MGIRKTKAVREGLRTISVFFEADFDSAMSEESPRWKGQELDALKRAMRWLDEQAREPKQPQNGSERT